MPTTTTVPLLSDDEYVTDDTPGSGARRWLYRGIVVFLILGAISVVIVLAVLVAKKRKSEPKSICTIPLPPDLITVSSPQPGTIIVTWQLVADASSYRVYRSTNAPNASGSIKSNFSESRPVRGTLNSTVFNDLSEANQYISIVSSNACGDGVESTVQQITMSCDLTAPSDLALTQTSSGNISASWSIVPGATYYEIFVQTGTASLVDKIPSSSNSLVYTFTGSGLVSVTVNAANSCSVGPLSSVTKIYGTV